MRDRLHDLDIGLLTAFETMLRERHVSRAADALGITQSALSSRVARLRNYFGDQLFVAVAGRGMTPTPRAVALAASLAETMAQLRTLTGPAPSFDPHSSDQTFVIAAYDNPAAILGPDLVPALKRSAPNIRLAFVLPGRDTVADTLERGAADLFVGASKAGDDRLIGQTLFNDVFMTAQRRGHPRGGSPLTLDAFCAADHLLISANGAGFTGLVDEALAKLGRKRRVSVSIQSYALAPVILASSDCLCTLPHRFLKQFETTLEVFTPPLDLGHFPLRALWHPRVKDDAAHRWLREQVFSLAAAERS